jgi:hypothetical protein
MLAQTFRKDGSMQLLEVFVYLQLLDLLTTMIGFRLGASEASPFVRMLTELGPGLGVALSKGIAIGLGGFCVATRRLRLIVVINYWFALLVLWNFYMIFRALETAH